MLKIVMDSAGDIPSEWLSDYEINVIPINIHFGEQTFYQGVDLSNEDFYQLVDESRTIPKTSQPTPHQFTEFYQQIADPGDTILSIHVTSKLSGTFSSAEIAAKELRDLYNIIPVDSGGGTASLGFMCREVRELEQSGSPLQRIMDRLDFIRKKTEIIFTINTLEYARLSGRVKALQSALASLLNVKPIVVLKNGILDMSEKARTRRRSIERVLEKMHNRIGDQLVNVAVVHARDSEMGSKLLEKVREIFNCKDLILTELSTGIAAHFGPGTIGIVAYPVMEG
jgi:DegV family protein with EDD domain